jgi:HD-GYP domain-containing protein (c-di-GMP phosphodiesterase class II)
MEKEVAVEELRRCSGTQLDRDVVEAFVQAFGKGEI